MQDRRNWQWKTHEREKKRESSRDSTINSNLHKRRLPALPCAQKSRSVDATKSCARGRQSASQRNEGKGHEPRDQKCTGLSFLFLLPRRGDIELEFSVGSHALRLVDFIPSPRRFRSIDWRKNKDRRCELSLFAWFSFDLLEAANGSSQYNLSIQRIILCRTTSMLCDCLYGRRRF